MIDRKYLPSEQFIARVIIIVIIIVVVLGMYGLVKFIKNKISSKSGDQPATLTIGNIIQKDSNNNGIADWEEYLWGLDPKKNGSENKEFISAKKSALTQSGDIVPTDYSQITDNEILSQQFFAAIISLQQSGQLDETAMNSVSEAIGKNVETTPIPDIYTSSMLTIQNDSTLTIGAYRDAIGNLVTKYQNADIGSELTFIIQALSNNDPQALYVATTVASSYQSFGQELVKIPVPRSLASAHLSAANNYEKTGQSIKNLAKVLADPIAGMNAILSYKQYNDALASDLEKISSLLQ